MPNDLNVKLFDIRLWNEEHQIDLKSNSLAFNKDKIKKKFSASPNESQGSGQ